MSKELQTDKNFDRKWTAINNIIKNIKDNYKDYIEYIKTLPVDEIIELSFEIHTKEVIVYNAEFIFTRYFANPPETVIDAFQTENNNINMLDEIYDSFADDWEIEGLKNAIDYTFNFPYTFSEF